MNYAFTVKSLAACIRASENSEWLEHADVPDDGSWQVLSVDRNNTRYIYHEDDSIESRLIIFIDRERCLLEPAPRPSWPAMIERIHRVALHSQHRPIPLPYEWSLFHEGNLLSFFATNEFHGELRWITEIGATSFQDVCFWSLTGKDHDMIRLEDFHPDHNIPQSIRDGAQEALQIVQSFFETLPRPQETELVQNAFDLSATTFGAVTQHKTYSTWLKNLTRQQTDFITSSSLNSVKLRGPAGSGKTLTLELKALYELYKAKQSGNNIKILFVTHSWAVAEQVDAAFSMMDESGDTSEIVVFPLLAIVSDGLPTERRAAGYQLLGEDSLSGKQLQLQYIDSIVESLIAGDWITYRSKTSQQFRSRIESPHKSPERNALVWDLMNEFSCVLSAHGILPGINAERRYLEIQRTSWMMPLSTDNDKRFVLDVYTRYIKELKNKGLITSDQLINDYINYLETFTWNLKRDKEGYDLIFVDELHLFNEQERLVLNYLTRSADVYPQLFMALDPRQSPSEIYFNVHAIQRSLGANDAVERDLGGVQEVVLSTVHRFTPEILDLVRHINLKYPTLELGPDWEVDLDSINSSMQHGEKPVVILHDNCEDEMRAVIVSANALIQKSKRNQRVAIVVLDPLKLNDYEHVSREHNANVSVIRSRDDVTSLQYRKKSIVLSAAEYVGGLQFDFVIISGFSEEPSSTANIGLRRRRFLSLLYLAVSRASQYVEMHVNVESGGVPNILEAAINNNIVTDRNT